MPFSPINIGTSANDGTGTPNRDAWQAVNAMLSEVYSTLATLVPSSTYDAAMAAFTATLTTVQEQVTNKADNSAVTAKANSVDVPIFTAAQEPALNVNQRLQLADNIGIYSTLRFDILDDDLEVVDVTQILKKLANSFCVKDVKLSVDSIPPEEGADYTASLTYGDTFISIASVSAFALPETLLVPLTVHPTNRIIPAGADRKSVV